MTEKKWAFDREHFRHCLFQLVRGQTNNDAVLDAINTACIIHAQEAVKEFAEEVKSRMFKLPISIIKFDILKVEIDAALKKRGI